MSDADLRALERLALDDPAQRPAWLAARMRSGELPRERVELAAYCGDEAAQELVRICKPGGPQPDSLVIYKDLSLWTKGLSRWGLLVQVRAGLAAARVANEIHIEATTFNYPTPGGGWGEHADYVPQDAIRAAQACLDDPSEENRARCRGLIPIAATALGPVQHTPEGCRWWSYLLCACSLGIWPGGLDGKEHGWWLPIAVGEAAELSGEQAVLKAMQRELIAWALGAPGRAS